MDNKEKGKQYNIPILAGKDKKYNIHIYKYIDIFIKVLYESWVVSCTLLSANNTKNYCFDFYDAPTTLRCQSLTNRPV